MPEIDDILKDRGSRYGDFGVQARTAQHIRDAFESSPNWPSLPHYMKEALSLMSTKFSRMLTGDPMYMDNVVDLIGYMTLMQREMEKWHESEEAALARLRDETKGNPYLRELRKSHGYAPNNAPGLGSPLFGVRDFDLLQPDD
jgi:hypothetical protein